MDVWRSSPPLALPAHVRALWWERFGHNALGLALADDDGRLRAATEKARAAPYRRLLDADLCVYLRTVS